MMNRSNFRVKLNLSEYYNDVRRFCWIYVDGAKILQIHQIKQHITKLFNIKEPFNLLLNDSDYLPPTEDVRILKESETIAVIPGSDLSKETEPASSTCALQRKQIGSYTQETLNNLFHHKEAQTIDFTEAEPIIYNQLTISNDTPDNSQQDASAIDITFHSILDNTEVDSATESKATDSNVTEDYTLSEHATPHPKRKRIRRRKSRNQTSLVTTNVNDDGNRPKKPKIIDSFIISSGKHIRFDTMDNEDNIAKQIVHEVSMNGTYPSKVCSKDLSALLALRQCSTPRTFANNKVKTEVKIENVSDEETRITAPRDKANNTKEQMQQSQNLLDVNYERYPIMTLPAKLKDVIAFKMLKIGPDYTPQISDFIIGEIISCSPETKIYTFKIIKGVDEVQVPIGKFTLPEDESETVISDTVTLNFAQLIEPRLVRTSTSS